MHPGDGGTLFLLIVNVVCANIYLATIPSCDTDVGRHGPYGPATTGCVHKRPSDLIVFFIGDMSP